MALCQNPGNTVGYDQHYSVILFNPIFDFQALNSFEFFFIVSH